MCGKVYYDLVEKRREKELNNTAIVRIEQLYPYPEARLAEVLAQYPNVKELVWAQEEPKTKVLGCSSRLVYMTM